MCMLDQMQLFKNWCYSNYNAAYTSNSDIENALNTHAEDLRQYERYTRKLSLLGDSSDIRRANCYIDNKTGKICCNKLIACLDNSRINEGQAVQEYQDIVQLFVEIPDFVEELVTSGDGILDFNKLAAGIYVSLRVKYNGNKFNKTYEKLFYNMKQVAYLNLTEFSFDNVVNARQMFKKSYNLVAVKFKPGTYDTLLYTSGMFEECHQLNRVNLDEVRIPKLFSMNGMFYKCSALKSIDLNFLCGGRYLSDMQYAFYSQGIEQLSLNQLEPRELNPDSLIDLRQLCQMCFNLTKLQINNGKQNQIPVNNMDGIAYELDLSDASLRQGTQTDGQAVVKTLRKADTVSAGGYTLAESREQGVYCLRRNGQLVLRCSWWGTWGKDLVVVGYAVVLAAVVITGLLRQAKKYQEKRKQGGDTAL